MLVSDRDGEVIAAVEALKRTLHSQSKDIHALADQIEKPNGGGLTNAEMKRIYDAGFSAGVRETENRQYGSGDFHNVDGTPEWHEIARFCQQHNDRLKPSERDFIDNVTARTAYREPTEKQEKWLRSIFYSLGGRL
jgi:hypothetical protein